MSTASMPALYPNPVTPGLPPAFHAATSTSAPPPSRATPALTYETAPSAGTAPLPSTARPNATYQAK